MQSRRPIIVADSHIPFLKGLLEPFAEVRYLDPSDITAETVREAEALIVRTRTICNAALLDGSKVQLIATATIGYDHIDTAYCKQHRIAWTNAPGCNANSVVNYVASACENLYDSLQGLCIGIIGAGQVGGRIAHWAREQGMQVLVNDPPRAAREGMEHFVSLDTLKHHADIITVHTPLDASTYHLIDSRFLSECQPNALIINAARGPICDTDALLQASQTLVIDCWENEPEISQELLKKVKFGTPHIAGYSQDGKANGTRMAVEAVCRHFGWDAKTIIPLEPYHGERYDIRIDSDALKANPGHFEQFRNQYRVRRDFYRYDSPCSDIL